MHIHDARLEISAVKISQYPNDNLPEVALIGRSNVGKSSFINRMVERTKLARTSGQPGKTQTINFYTFNESFRIVDVPGYGYARVSKKDRERWRKMIDDYLRYRQNLQLVFILMDIRHEPSQLDQEMYQYLEGLGLPFAVILTKSDKIKSNQFNKYLNIVKKALDLPTVDALFPFSSQTGQGSEEIWEIITDFLLNQKDGE